MRSIAQAPTALNSLFDEFCELAEERGTKAETTRKWRQRGIPSSEVIELASVLQQRTGRSFSLDQLAELSLARRK